MALFEYAHITVEGRKQRGFIDADNLENAKDKLRRQGVLYLTVRLYKKLSEKALFRGSKLFVIHFTRELAQLLQSGLPLYETLVTLREKYQKKKEAALILDFCEYVKEGKYLSEALKKYPKLFDSIYVAMVQSAETSGTLDVVFFELSTILEKNLAIEREIKKALIYPAALLSFAFFLLMGLFFYLIPSMKDLFEDRPIHPLTQSIIRISNWLTTHALLFFITLFSTVILAWQIFRRATFKNAFKNFLLKIPICKKIITESVVMRFSRTFALLLKSGIVALEALRLSKKVLNFPRFERVFDRIEAELLEGKAMSEGLRGESIIPPLFTRMLATGEKTGSQGEMLMHVAKMYEDNLNRSIAQFLQFLQPMLLVILAIIIGTIVLSILLPLTDVSTLS